VEQFLARGNNGEIPKIILSSIETLEQRVKALEEKK